MHANDGIDIRADIYL